MVFPTLGVSLVKHLGQRFNVAGGATWTGGFSEFRSESLTHVRANGAFQVLERVVEVVGVRQGRARRSWSGSLARAHGGRRVRARVPARSLGRCGGGVRLEAWWNNLTPQPPPLPSDPSPLPPRRPGRRFPILWASAWRLPTGD